jgi:hypothetical protein
MLKLISNTAIWLLQFLPVLVGGIFWLIVSFIIQTGAKNDTWADRGGEHCPCGLFVQHTAAVIAMCRRHLSAPGLPACVCCADGFATYVGAIFGVVACIITLAVVMPLLKGRIFKAADMVDR